MDDATREPLASFSVLGSHPKVLWLASSGGHLAQAHRIEGLIGRNSESHWMTFAGPQASSLLQGRRVTTVDYVPPRDLRGALRAARVAMGIVKHESFDLVVSTGAAIAVAALPALALAGQDVVYVESISRSTGPSLTGRVMAVAPRVKTLGQYEAWAGGAWKYGGSVLDDYNVDAAPGSTGPRRVFVTLGTIRPYRFDRAVDAVLSALRDDDEVVWQLGATARSDLPGAVFDEMPAHDIRRRMLEADVVVTHAGVGSVLGALDAGKVPVLVVRRRKHGEHVDDHQAGIAEVMSRRGLALELDPDRPLPEALDVARSRKVVLRSA